MSNEHLTANPFDLPSSARTLMPTFTGLRIDPLDPDPASINLIDIAHSLAHQCRWAGHGSKFYSVAEHSIRMMQVFQDGRITIPFEALMHDASEYLLVDVPRPVKRYLTGYQAMEDRIAGRIAAVFSLGHPWDDAVRFWDDQFIHAEARWLGLAADPTCQGLAIPWAQREIESSAMKHGGKIGWKPQFTAAMFLHHANSLWEQRKSEIKLGQWQQADRSPNMWSKPGSDGTPL